MLAPFQHQLVVAPGRILLIIGLATVVALGAAGESPLRALKEPNDPNAHLVRWGSVAVEVNDSSGVSAYGKFFPPEMKPPDGGQVLILAKDESKIAIDADTGDVLLDETLAPDKSAIEAVLATLQIGPFGQHSRAWPVGDVAPVTPRERYGNLSFAVPDPASGFSVYTEIADCSCMEGASYAIVLENGRSHLSIDASTGEIIEATTKIDPKDNAAIDNFLAEIEYFPRVSPP